MAKTYKESGVDIDAGNRFVELIGPHVKSTYGPEVLAGVGGFAAHYLLNLSDIKEPVLVPSTDGVGTKLLIAKKLNKYNTIGFDLVAMCVNDILCSGAFPLFFLDYFAAERLRPEEHSEIVKGIAEACKVAKCALVGGETAELPGIYPKDEIDLAGFAVGIVDRKKIIDGSKISHGDTVIGIASSGLHSNGYSLARSICNDAKLDLNNPFSDTGENLGETLLSPTKIYVSTVHNLIRKFEIRGLAHITGGGLQENIPRILPDNCRAKISLDSWERPEIFRFLQEKGSVEEKEMRRVFNLGIGMIVVVPSENAAGAAEEIRLSGETPFFIGKIEGRKRGESAILIS